MTVSATTNKISYPGNGSTTSFTFPFPGVAASDILVFITSNLGVVTQLLPIQYQVTLNVPIAPNPTSVGGSVLYPTAGPPLGGGNLLTIIRTVPQTQATSLVNQGILYPAAIEVALDYLTMINQQISELQGRSISVQPSDSVPTLLPAAAARANLLMGFDSSGNPIAIAGAVSNVIVSVAMQPVVTASTLINARAAMGVASPNLGLQVGVSGAGLMDANSQCVHFGVNFSPSASGHMVRFVCDANLIIVLPKANTMWNGYSFWVSTRAHTVTLTPAAGDRVNDAAISASFVLPNNSFDNSWFISTDAIIDWFL